MFGYPKWRAWTVIVVSVFSLFFALPNFMSSEYYQQNVPKGMQGWWHPMTLGLDLQGGSQLLLEIQTEDLLKEKLGSIADSLPSVLRENDIRFDRKALTVEDGVLTVKVLEASQIPAVQKIISAQDTAKLSFEVEDKNIKVSYSDEAVSQMKSGAVSQAIEIVRRRIDDLGTKEPSIQREGADRILIQLPGVSNATEVKSLLGKTAKITFHLVNEDITLADLGRGKRLPPDSMLLDEEDGGSLIVKKAVIVGGEQLDKASVSRTEYGEVAVDFSFMKQGAKKFAQATRENVGRRLAIVLDGKVLSAPVIKSEISGGSGNITGNFTIESASELALMLRSGALPAPLKDVEERVVGAGLGEDSIRSGAYACIIGSVLVFAFMFFVYGWFGVFANIALLVNVFLIFAILSALGATLTLPGLAGIALTIGMAVDSNVLIYARMHDEAVLGRSPLQVINAGFDNSFTAIIDSQITTLIAAIVLFFMGSGPIKGFSVTLGVGVFTSLFTAIMITKFLIMIWYSVYKPKTIKL